MTRSSSTAGARGLALILVLACASACGGDDREAPAPGAAAATGDVASGAPEDSPREEFRAIADRLEAGRNAYVGRDQVATLRELGSEPGLNAFERITILNRLAAEHLRLGEMTEAVSASDRAWQLVWEDRSRGVLLPATARMRGLVHLRLAEVENCIRKHNAECCIFPLEGGGVHTLPAPAQEAARMYGTLLKHRPDDLAMRWNFNVLAMAMGMYPEKVPPPLLIPPSAFESEADVGRFVDVAPKLGLDTLSNCGGCIVEDFDEDGHLDVIASNFNPRGPLVYHRSDGRGGFEDRSQAAGLDAQLGGLNCIGADYDGDGDTDVLVLRGAWLLEDGQIRNSLLRNEGDGTFTDVTRAAGLAAPAWPTQAAAWLDFDGDGHLDLFVGNESIRGGIDLPAQLFRNRGDGTFEDVAVKAGVTNDRYCKGVTAGDYDNDGDMDLYVSNVGPNRLYRNEGDGTFTDVAAAAGVTEPAGRSFASWFFDWDNDGWLDLFVAAYDADVEDVAAHYLGRKDDASRPRLYRNRRDGTFEDLGPRVGLDRPFLPMGANFGDLDNDGWLDVFLTTGDPDYQTLVPSIMLRNDAGRRFQDVTRSGGFGHLQKGHGVAFADLDNDGDQDVFHELGGFYPGDAFANALFLNPGHGNHWLTVELVGRRTNRQGVGVRLEVVVATPAGTRAIHRAAGSVSSFGGSPARQEIGLGDATRIERLTLWWPGSKARQVFTEVPLDGFVRATEGEPGLERLDRKRLSF